MWGWWAEWGPKMKNKQGRSLRWVGPEMRQKQQTEKGCTGDKWRLLTGVGGDKAPMQDIHKGVQAQK